jgi:hypothetical protein
MFKKISKISSIWAMAACSTIMHGSSSWIKIEKADGNETEVHSLLSHQEAKPVDGPNADTNKCQSIFASMYSHQLVYKPDQTLASEAALPFSMQIQYSADDDMSFNTVHSVPPSDRGTLPHIPPLRAAGFNTGIMSLSNFEVRRPKLKWLNYSSVKSEFIDNASGKFIDGTESADKELIHNARKTAKGCFEYASFDAGLQKQKPFEGFLQLKGDVKVHYL